MKRVKRYTAGLLCCVLLSCLLAGCSGGEVQRYETKEDFAEAKLGIITGSSHEGTAKREFPDAERVYFTAMADMVLAVEQGKIDAYLEDEQFLTAAIWEGAHVKKVEQTVSQVENGFVFPQNEASRPLREEINAFLEEAKADGTIDRLREKWLEGEEPTEHPDYASLEGTNGTIRLAVCVDNKPMGYLYEGRCTGFEIELLTLFASRHGYAFDIQQVPFESVLAGIATEKYDMASAGLNITAEREESVDFSIPYGSFGVVLVVKDDGTKDAIETLEELETATLGIVTGTNWDLVAQERFPHAPRKYFTSAADVVLAVEQGKVDAFLADEAVYAGMRWENHPIVAIDEPVATISNALVFAKEGYDEALLGEVNAFIAASRENGTLDALAAKWFGDEEPAEHPDYTKLAGEKGTLRIAVGDSMRPVAYQRGDLYTGYEVEFLTLFAEACGYRLELEGMAFEALLPSVASGKCDIGACGITITPERMESVTFSNSHFETDGVAVVYEGGRRMAEKSFWDELKEDFTKTFIREDRWKLIVGGIGVTVLISLCAAVAGSLLGFGLYLLSCSDRKGVRLLARGVAKVYSRVVEGTPVVVILMILFYVVFGKFHDISGILVAIIGFSVTFGAFVYDHMHVAVNSVDRGQTEAACALGYTKNKTFFRIVFPQAMSIFLPSYCAQAGELVKATAVVGYIAVNDLTKVGDIIRSNTYEAFFPLITTAVIYFLLTWLLSLALGRVKARFDPKRRGKEQILKGVKTV